MGGGKYKYFRVLLLPLLILLKSMSNIDIHYAANIGSGLVVLHHSLGIVINGQVVIGKNLTLTGGNVIGVGRKRATKFTIGDNVSLGANAVIVGSVCIGDNVIIGALACVTRNYSSGCTLVGVPAKPIAKYKLYE